MTSPQPDDGGRLDVARLRDHVVRWVRGSSSPPRSAGARVEYVPNWGGFGNASFRVRDGVHDLRLKLAYDAEAIARLRRWESLASILHERYAAPRMEGWAHIPGTPYEGPVFEWVEGRIPTAVDAALASRVGALLERLADDEDVASALSPSAGRRTCRDVYLSILDRRFREDLRLLEAERPPFVSSADLEWFRLEIDAIAHEVAVEPAFDEPARSATHGDLWLDNLILGPKGRLAILDWDDLALGDPVLDWSTFLGPTRADLRASDARLLPPRLAASRAARERFRLHGRAHLLDWIVDGMADWIEAQVLDEPERSRVRAEKERTIRSARRAYETRVQDAAGS